MSVQLQTPELAMNADAGNKEDASASTANHGQEAALLEQATKQTPIQPSLSPDVPENATMSIDPEQLPFNFFVAGVEYAVNIPRKLVLGQREIYPIKPELDPEGYNTPWDDTNKTWKAKQSQPSHVTLTHAIFSRKDDPSTQVKGVLYCTSPQVGDKVLNRAIPGEVSVRLHTTVCPKYKTSGKYHIICEDGNSPFAEYETHTINVKASIEQLGWSWVNSSKDDKQATHEAKDSEDEFEEEVPHAPPSKGKGKKAEESAAVATEAPMEVANEGASQESAPEAAADAKKPRKRGPSKKKLAEDAAAAAAAAAANQSEAVAPSESELVAAPAPVAPAATEERVTGRKRPAAAAESSSKRHISEFNQSSLAFFEGSTGLLAKMQEAYCVGWGKPFQSITFDFVAGDDEPRLIVTREGAN